MSNEVLDLPPVQLIKGNELRERPAVQIFPSKNGSVGEIILLFVNGLFLVLQFKIGQVDGGDRLTVLVFFVTGIIRNQCMIGFQ